jgi:hypothetical protein
MLTNTHSAESLLNGRLPTHLKASPVAIRWTSALPLYASEEFLKLGSTEYGWIGGTEPGGELRCIVPFSVLRKPGFRMIRFRHETVPLGADLTLEEERAFLENVIQHFRSSGADLIIPAGNTAIFRTYPHGAIAAPYGTYVIDLQQPEETLSSAVHSTFRYNIRRAGREGVQIREGHEHLDAAYDLVAETLGRSGMSFKTREEFRTMILGLGNNVQILVAVKGDVIQGCMVAPFSGHTAYTWYCGSRLEPVIGAMHLLHWEAILRFRKMGVRHFNFQGVRINPEEGSKQEGLLNFKRRFGGRLVQGFMWKYSLKSLQWALYSTAVRLKGGDIVDQEQHKLQSFGQAEDNSVNS